jgi:hypothetical protein
MNYEKMWNELKCRVSEACDYYHNHIKNALNDVHRYEFSNKLDAYVALGEVMNSIEHEHNIVKISDPIVKMTIMHDNVIQKEDGEVYFEVLITMRSGDVHQTYINVEDYKKIFSTLSETEN